MEENLKELVMRVSHFSMKFLKKTNNAQTICYISISNIYNTLLKLINLKSSSWNNKSTSWIKAFNTFFMYKFKK